MVTLANGAGAVVGRIAAAGSDAGAVNVAGAFNGIQGAMVGSDTEQACTMLGARFGAAVKVYAANLGTLSSTINSAQAGITSTDQGVGQAFGANGPQGPSNPFGVPGPAGPAAMGGGSR